jgi:hypothetical protein
MPVSLLDPSEMLRIALSTFPFTSTFDRQIIIIGTLCSKKSGLEKSRVRCFFQILRAIAEGNINRYRKTLALKWQIHMKPL